MSRICCTLVAVSLLFTSLAWGGTRPPMVFPPSLKIAAEGPKETPRLQKLKQLQFDRRPSAILKAWAPAPPEPAKPDDPKAKKKDPLDEELDAFRRHVTLGNWTAVKAYLAGLPEDEGKAGFKQLLQALQSAGGGPMGVGGPGMGGMVMQPGMPAMPMPQQFMERNSISVDDLLGLASAAPRGVDKDAMTGLGAILRQMLTSGIVVEAVVARLATETAKPKDAVLTTRQSAQLLAAADQAASAAGFLPPLQKALADKDLEALNLLARLFLGLHAREGKGVHLEQAWAATQAILAASGSRIEQEEALRRAVELAPKLKAELGQTWLEQSFTDKPERGMDILATIGALASQGMQTQPMTPDLRLKSLQLQKTAIEALLKAAPDNAKTWRETLSLLAGNWLREAEFTYQYARGSGAARMRRDPYGNIFYYSEDDPYNQQMMMRQQGLPQPVAVVDMLIVRPEESWLQHVRDDLRPKLAMTLCQLHLKADEEAKAFPYIEQLAPTHPLKARDLVNEFLRVWTRNHDPNAARAYTNPYFFMYGFERRAEGIPLTRSKQERNLIDLAGVVERLKKLPIGDPDEELLAKAFTTCHSNAEVYRTEAVERVFGPMGGLKPKTLGGLAQQMRENLAGLWRQPAEQQDKKTNRKTKDIQAEVLRGYGVALAMVDDALKKFPDEWSLVLARAALMHDENGFRQELAKSSEFAARRDAAHREFQRAARLYAAKVTGLPDDEQSARVYEQWFYAGLGACDLGHITEEKQPDLRQPALIRAAILALPGEAAEKHLSRFANALFTRMSSVKPAAKFNYLKGGFQIVGEHKQAAEAKKVFDYYRDLVTEIKLEAVIDGSTSVGHKQPFGVFVNIRHTREIERESGGFSRYLQNQNTNLYFSYNYGRPTADYRDKFQTAATEALKEHFDVLSATFQSDKVNSRATAEYGWRVTPYAYFLLKARGPQVDKLPPLRIDLDFLDTSGYVVLPIESPAVAMDARPERADPRPAEKIQVTQILDERQAHEGRLILEVKATALGLVPELTELLTFQPAGFDIAKTVDQGVSVTKFDPDSAQTAVASDRTWLITLTAQPGQGSAQPAPKEFRFATARRDGLELVYHRYQDADLVNAESVVLLERAYHKRSFAWAWWAGVATLAVLVFGFLLYRQLRRPRTVGRANWQLPEPLTPFTALGFLERLDREGRLSAGQRAELKQAIQGVERHYFAENTNGDPSPDLKGLTEGWLQRAR